MTTTHLTFYAVQSGAGTDDVCAGCLEEAIREGRHRGNIVSWAELLHSERAECAFCGVEGSDQ